MMVTWASLRTVWGTTRRTRPGPTSLSLNLALAPCRTEQREDITQTGRHTLTEDYSFCVYNQTKDKKVSRPWRIKWFGAITSCLKDCHHFQINRTKCLKAQIYYFNCFMKTYLIEPRNKLFWLRKPQHGAAICSLSGELPQNSWGNGDITIIPVVCKLTFAFITDCPGFMKSVYRLRKVFTVWLLCLTIILLCKKE